MKHYDIIAEIYYHKNGRQTPVLSGYRPQINFLNYDMQTSGTQIFINKNIVYPSSSVKTFISLLSKSYFKNKLNINDVFLVKEGNKIVGNGRILKIINKDLICKC